MKYVKLFSDWSFNIDLLGGKGSNLVKLAQNKYNIPDGFIISTEAYKDFIKSSKYLKELDTLFNTSLKPQNILTISKKIKKHILDSQIPIDIKDEIKITYESFHQKVPDELRFAVRSSANIEDGDTFSFAGQADTYLFRKSLRDIMSSVKACWSSLFNPRALLYLSQMNKLHKKTKLNEICMAVIIQQMINSDISGVLFTVNVLNNNTEEMLINSTWGLGEALANNCVIPDTLIINKHTYNSIKTIIGKKEKKAVPDYTHSTTKLINTSRKLQKSCCLNKKYIKNICEVGKSIEQLYNCPQDIEWAIKDDELFILQTRPITTFKRNQKESHK